MYVYTRPAQLANLAEVNVVKKWPSHRFNGLQSRCSLCWTFGVFSAFERG